MDINASLVASKKYISELRSVVSPYIFAEVQKKC